MNAPRAALQGHEQPKRVVPGDSMQPYASQTETLMATQDARERAEAKGKGKGPPLNPANQAQSMGPPVKPTYLTPLPAGLPPEKPPVNPASDKGSPMTTEAADSTNALPVKRGRGRPRKTDIVVPTGTPPPKRPRGRPRKSAPAATNRADPTSEAESDAPKADGNDDSDYQESDTESSHAVPPNILAQFTAHVAILRTRLDPRGIPEQYSVFKSFWVPSRSTYFDNGATAPPGRFMYWDPLFITSVACPVCQQPLAIAAGGGWLDEPLCIRDEEGPCWIIGRRYVCTQCFSATEEAARYVQGPAGGSDPHGATSSESKTKVDYSSPVYYLSWEKRFCGLLPPALASEFPKRAKKRAAFNRAAVELAAGAKAGEVDADMEGEDEIEEEEDAEAPKQSRRVRHCMKCGSKACPGRAARSRCANPCHDCRLSGCNGRLKPNVTCKGELCTPFKETSPEAASSRASTTAPAAPQSISWPSGLPSVPSGFVLAIPYAVGVDGKPTGAQPAAAYLVPQGEVPGFTGGASNQPAASSSAEASTSGTEAQGSVAPEQPAASTSAVASTPEPTPVNPAPANPAPAAQPAQPEPEAQPKAAAQPKAKGGQKAKAANQKAAAAAAVSAPAPQPQPPHQSHPHPPPHPLPHHNMPYPPQHPGPYPPHPPPAGSPDQGFYGGFYPYGYAPYGYGYYPPYPPQGSGPNPPGPGPSEPGAAPPPGQYPHYPPFQPGYGPPPQGGPYPHPPPNGFAMPPGGSGPAQGPPHGYNPPPPGNQQQQPRYMPYQPPEPPRPAPATATATSGPGTKKRKVAPGAGEKTAEANS